MIKTIHDPQVIQKMCEIIMAAGAIPDARNIQGYLNLHKDIWGGAEEEMIYSTAISHGRNDLGNYVRLVSVDIVPTIEWPHGKWQSVVSQEQAIEKALKGACHE